MKLTNQEIQKHISELPDSIRKAVVTFDWSKEIMAIGNIYKLHMDQIEDFRYETLMVILGISSSADYANTLSAKLNLKKNIAQELVEESNARIFSELQKRAFPRKQDESQEPEYDDYLEPIDHHDLRGPMAKAGVHLIDEDNPRPVSSLQQEIDKLGMEPVSVNPKIDHRSLNSFEMDSAERIDTIEDNNNSHSENTLVFKDQFNQEITQSTITNSPAQGGTDSYSEDIDESDLIGIGGHRIDTEILKTKNHMKPESIFEGNEQPATKSMGRDLGQGLTQSLDKHLMDNPFIAKGDSINISPTQQEQIKENGTFLQNLKKES